MKIDLTARTLTFQIPKPSGELARNLAEAISGFSKEIAGLKQRLAKLSELADQEQRLEHELEAINTGSAIKSAARIPAIESQLRVLAPAVREAGEAVNSHMDSMFAGGSLNQLQDVLVGRAINLPAIEEFQAEVQRIMEPFSAELERTNFARSCDMGARISCAPFRSAFRLSDSRKSPASLIAKCEILHGVISSVLAGTFELVVPMADLPPAEIGEAAA